MSNESKRIIDLTKEEIDALVRENETLISKVSDRHEVHRETKEHFANLQSAYRKALKSEGVDREALADAIFAKMSEYLDGNVRDHREFIISLKGKNEALLATKGVLEKHFTLVTTEETRVREIASKIENGEAVPNGRSRKPGTRPEKISDVRKAEELLHESAKQKSETSS